MKPVHSFIVSANLPQRIAKLKELAYNYWWCWNFDAKELFIRINPSLWEQVNHNPVLLINKLSQERLQRLAEQADFTSYLDYQYSKFTKYLESKSWFDSQNVNNGKGVIAYFSMEYGINESFPNYSGGLGVLSGDHLKSASDLGLPLVGIGLLYQQGYFRQQLTQSGWQNELYLFNDFFSMPIVLLKNNSGEPFIIDVDFPAGKCYAQIWKMQIGRISLYLLDTNLEKNSRDEYRDVTDQLYGGSRDTRIQQEIILGIGGMKALNLLGITPEVIHINEGHAAFALVERIKMFMEKYHLDFRAAKQIVKGSSIFTTHTPVPAGNEAFKTDRVEYYFTNYIKQLGMSKEDFMMLGQVAGYSPVNDFSMTVLGLRLTGYHNAVSALHGKVARKMWHEIWKCFPEDEVPIKAITNGIHTMTWVCREFAELFDRYLTPRWKTETDKQEIWDKIDYIPNEELWREKSRRRIRLILFARKYLQIKQKAFLAPEQVNRIKEYLNPDALTIGFARRFATYKRATLIFRDMERLSAILKNPDKPVQILIAGKAHPHDTQGKEVIQSIIQKVRAYGLEKHVVFLEDYDMVIARLLIKGCDVWLNTPIRPLEASGTSGMKAAINGTVNLSILDGWWDEGFTGSNGFAIGHGEEYINHEEQEIIESGSLYDLLEQVILPLFFDRSSVNRIPDKWIQHMKESIKTCAGRFSTMRMVKDYCNEYYIPALSNFKTLTYNNGTNADKLKCWKDKVREQWQHVEIIDVTIKENGEPFIGKPINVAATVSLGGLTPDDVQVEVYYGTVNPHDELENTSSETLKLVKSEKNLHYYGGSYLCPDTGQQGFTVRILPTNPLMGNPAELYICAWAQ